MRATTATPLVECMDITIDSVMLKLRLSGTEQSSIFSNSGEVSIGETSLLDIDVKIGCAENIRSTPVTSIGMAEHRDRTTTSYSAGEGGSINSTVRILAARPTAEPTTDLSEQLIMAKCKSA